MEEWIKIRLGDIVEVSSGFSYKGEYIGSGRSILLGMGCVSFKEKFLMSGARPYSGESPDRFHAQPGDIVLATRQQSENLPILGMPAIIPDSLSGHDVIVGANLYRIINNSEIDNRFLYLQLKTPHYLDHINKCKTGTTVRMITKKNIEDYVFLCPPKEAREKIVSMLWNIEDKIDLNKRINHNLEEQAQALYKSWFVDYEPFRGGNFVDSELGMIPEGWRVGELSEIINITSGKRPSTKSDYPTSTNIVPVYGASGIMAYTTDKLYDIPILLIGRVGTLGIVQKIDDESWPSDNTLVIMSNNYHFVYYILKTIDYKAINRGSTQPLITQSDIKQQMVLIPPDKVLMTFEQKASILDNAIKNNDTAIMNLALLRDTLLPKLMSGELKINDLTC